MVQGEIDADLIEYAYWSRNIRGLSDNTIRTRLDFLRRLHIFLGHPLREAQTGEILRFERMAIAGRAPESRRAYACHIRAFYRWAVTTGVVTDDPSTLLTIPRIPKHLPRPIEEDDLALALAAARPKMRAILTLAAYAGLRAVEIAGLDWSDLRREPDGSAFLHVRKGKGAKERTVEVGQTVIRALQAHGVKRRGPIFLGLEGRPMNAGSISRSAGRFLRNQGIDCTLHQLRHRYGTIGYQLTHDLRLMQEQLGHASPNTTAGYARVARDAGRRLAHALDELPLPRPRPSGPAPAGTSREHEEAPRAPTKGRAGGRDRAATISPASATRPRRR